MNFSLAESTTAVERVPSLEVWLHPDETPDAAASELTVAALAPVVAVEVPLLSELLFPLLFELSPLFSVSLAVFDGVLFADSGRVAEKNPIDFSRKYTKIASNNMIIMLLSMPPLFLLCEGSP